MKKVLLSTLAIFTFVLSSSAQNYFAIKKTGVVPGAYNYKTAGTTILAATNDNTFSATRTIPFAFNFFGTNYTQFKASDNGFITFDLTETNNGTTAASLPSAGTTPRNAIFAFWYDFKLAAGAGIPDKIATFNYGTAPNRTHVIQWLSITTKGSSYCSFAIRLHENGTFDVIHNQVGATGNTGTVGVNNVSGTDGWSSAGAPTTSFVAPSADDDYPNMVIYTFYPGPQAALDLSLTEVNIPSFIKKGVNANVTGKVLNLGSSGVISYDVNYQVNNGSVMTHNVTGVGIAASGGENSFTHATPINEAVAGTTGAVKVWISNVNSAGADGNAVNDSGSGDYLVNNGTSAQRNFLFEEAQVLGANIAQMQMYTWLIFVVTSRGPY